MKRREVNYVYEINQRLCLMNEKACNIKRRNCTTTQIYANTIVGDQRYYDAAIPERFSNLPSFLTLKWMKVQYRKIMNMKDAK